MIKSKANDTIITYAIKFNIVESMCEDSGKMKGAVNGGEERAADKNIWDFVGSLFLCVFSLLISVSGLWPFKDTCFKYYF